MSKIVAFSGASHSGKTQTMKELCNLYPNKIISFTEIIREIIKIPSIDNIRKNPNDYLDLEMKIISQKIEQEKIAYDDDKDCIYIFDRSLVDSFYYYLFYVDKNNLNMDLYQNYLEFLLEKIDQHFKMYSMIFLFKPIKNIEKLDIFRVKNLNIVQNNEYKIIKILTLAKKEKEIYEVEAIKDFNKIKEIILNVK
ncbi:AAA family ATPase [Patescibacteria group bacterium]|nr:AAA family ATPase [Patescibacteria group bacterium]